MRTRGKRGVHWTWKRVALAVTATAAALASRPLVRGWRTARPEKTQPVSQAGAGGTATKTEADADAAGDGHMRWSCACGQEYRVSGTGRHRVFWLVDAAESDPVLANNCVGCGRELPSGQ
jgi:hypothetical protein